MKLDTLFRKFKGRCCFCGHRTLFSCRRKFAPAKATREHLLPRSLGGKNGDNLVLACSRCNMLRGTMPAEVFLAIARTLPFPTKYVSGAARRALLDAVQSGGNG